MRILVVSDVSGYMPGGVPAEARQLMTALAERGHELLYAGDVAVVPAAVADHAPIDVPIGDGLPARLQGLIDGFRPDVVHVLCMSSRGVLALAPVLRGRPWVLTVHSVSPYERKLNRAHGSERLHYGLRALRFLANTLAWRWVFRRVAIPRVIVHSDFVADIVGRYGFDRQRVDRILLPFRPAAGDATVRPARGGHEPVLVTVGGLAHTKGQHDVVKALPALAKRHPGIRYHMIGEVRDSTYVEWLRSLAEHLGVAQRLTFSFGLDNAAKADALAKASVYVQPSHEEGFCLSYIEAAAVVARLVGTDSGAIAAMSRDDPGARVVSIASPDALAAAVIDVMAAELPETHMAERTGRLSTRFSESAYAEGHLGAYARAEALAR